MPLTTTNPSADSFYDDMVNVSAFLYKKALTDLPTDVREAIATAKNIEGEMGKKFLNSFPVYCTCACNWKQRWRRRQ